MGESVNNSDRGIFGLYCAINGPILDARVDRSSFVKNAEVTLTAVILTDPEVAVVGQTSVASQGLEAAAVTHSDAGNNQILAGTIGEGVVQSK